MTPRRILTRTALVAVLLAMTSAVVGIGPAAHAALAGLTYVTAKTGFDSAVYKSVRVQCPDRTRVVGGFFRLIGAEGAVVLDDFIPSETDLLVGAGEIVGPGEPADGTTVRWEVEATVACATADQMPVYGIIEKTSNFTSTSAKSAEAVCPSGTKLIGAGASLRNGFGQVSIARLESTGTSVSALAGIDADGYGQLWSVTAYAICVTGSMFVTSQTAPSKSPQILASLSSRADCQFPLNATSVDWNIFPARAGSVDRYITSARSFASTVGIAEAFESRSSDSAWSLTSETRCVS